MTISPLKYQAPTPTGQPIFSVQPKPPEFLDFLKPENVTNKLTSLGFPTYTPPVTPVPLKVSEPLNKYQNLTDLIQGPSLALGKFLIEPTWNFLSSGAELITGKPLPKLTIPALTKNIGNYAEGSSYQQKYQEAINSGVPEKEAYKNTLIGGIMDAVALAEPIQGGLREGLLRFAPEKLITPSVESVSKESLFDYFSGRKTPEQLGFTPQINNQIREKMASMTTQEKAQFLQGFDLLDAKPSTLGKIFGVDEEQAKNILSDVYNGPLRQASAGALPGYMKFEPNPQSGFMDLGFGEPRRGKPIGFGNNQDLGFPAKPAESSIPKDLEPLAAEARKYKSAEEFINSFKITDQSNPNSSLSPLVNNIGIENFGGKGVFQLPRVNTNPTAVASWEEKIKTGENPIIYTGGLSPRLIDGNNRLQAYKNLGFKEVPVVQEQQLKDLYNETKSRVGIHSNKDVNKPIDFYNKAVGETPISKSQQVENSAETAKNFKPGENFGPRNQDLTPTQLIDKEIAKGNVRVVSRDNTDIYQIKKGEKWVNTRGEDDALQKLSGKPKPKAEPKPKVYAPKDQEKLDFNKAQLENVREILQNHPAKPLLPFLKEGDFQDFKNPDLAETPKEVAKIKAKNKEIINAAEKAFQDNPELHNKFDNPDTIRKVIEEYRNHRDVEKTLLATKKDLNTNLVPLLDENKVEAEILRNLKDEAVKERRRQLEKAQKKINETHIQKEERKSKINSEITKPIDNRKLNTIKPKYSLDEDTRGIYEKFSKKINEAKVVGLKYTNKFTEEDKLGPEAYDQYQLIGDAPHQKEIQDILSKLYKYAQDNGFPELPHRKNYLPQMYKGTHDKIPPLEIRKKLAEDRLKKEGASPEEIKKYVDQMVDSEDQSVHLKKNGFFQKYKFFTSYAEAREYGYLPKYTKMSELLGVYNKLILETTAARTFIEDLTSAGKIVPEQVAPYDWQPIKYGPQGIRGYWASPKISNFIDGIFRGHENMGLTDTITSGVANLSRFGQNLALSGGIPMSSFNFFSAGILNKELMRGNLKAFNSFTTSNSDKATVESLQKDYKYIEMMAQNGIPFRSIAGVPKENYENIKTKWGKFTKGVKEKPLSPSSYSPFFQIVGDSIDNVFGKKTFDNFLPLLNVQVFRDSYNSLIKSGVDDKLAQSTAARLTSLSQGILEDLGRSTLTQDRLTATFFAPVYRESIIGVLTNTLKSVTTEIKNPLYRFNRHFFAGLVIALGVYNLINEKLNGHSTWDNPQGHEVDLRIPLPNGQVAYIPFMPGFLAMPRSIIGAIKGIWQGDVKKAVDQGAQNLSMVVKTTFDVLTNNNYFGNPIYNDTDSRATKISKVAKYVGLEFDHPYIKELVNQLTDKPKPLYQSILTATELPIKFSTQSKENTSAFYNAIADKAAKNKEAKDSVSTIRDKVIELAKQGKKEEVLKLVKDFTPEQIKLYKQLNTEAKTKNTQQAEQQMLPTILKVRELIKKGDKKGVAELVKNFTPEDIRIYKLASSKI